MLLRNSLLTVLLLAVPASAAEPVLLAWKFKEGDTFHVLNESKIDQTISFMGNEVPQKINQSAIAHFKVVSVTKDKVVLEQTILETKQSGAEADPRVAERMKGVKFTITLNAQNQLIGFEGYKEFLDKLSDKNEQTRNQLAAVLPEDTFRQAIQETFDTMPGKTVKLKDTWKRKAKLSMGPIGNFDTNATFTYAGTKKVGDRTLDSVNFTSELKYSPPDKQLQGLPFTISKGTMKADSFEGVQLFDAKLGRLAETRMTMKVSGDLTFKLENNETEVKIVQMIKMSSVITKEKPSLEPKDQ